MHIYLIRHAEAADTVPDFARPLSAHGREQVALLARFLGRSKAFSPAEVWHSPLVRARETAEGIVRELALATRLREVPGLTPEDNPHLMAGKLREMTEPVAVVGHEPHLSALATLLVTRAMLPNAFAMKKGATLALERGGSSWVVRWHVEPGLLG